MAEYKLASPVIGTDGGQAFIRAYRCNSCQSVMTESRLACPACASREGFGDFRAAPKGKLVAWSIVHRSYPGIPVPFISAIVDLDDGVTLKGNLIDADPKPDSLFSGMPVELVFGDALGRRDSDNAAYLAYFFKPATSE